MVTVIVHLMGRKGAVRPFQLIAKLKNKLSNGAIKIRSDFWSEFPERGEAYPVWVAAPVGTPVYCPSRTGETSGLRSFDKRLQYDALAK